MARVFTLYGSFYQATSLNADIGGRDTASVTNLGNIFFGASSLDRSTSGWDLSSLY